MVAVNFCNRCLLTTLVVTSTALILKFCFTSVDFSRVRQKEVHIQPWQPRQPWPEDDELYQKRKPTISGSIQRRLNSRFVNDGGSPMTTGPSNLLSFSGKQRNLKRSSINDRLSSSTELRDSVPSSLPADVIDKVEKFVFFIGYPRSGHSIIGSFMDAHPHMVIAHEFMLFKKLRNLNEVQELDQIELLQSKSYLFDSLYNSSIEAAMSGWRSKDRNVKNYTLSVDSPWLGMYDRYISVIGDKSGGKTAKMYLQEPEQFTAHYQQLKKTLEIPIKVIHCIRNPYDMVSTNALYLTGYMRNDETFVSNFKLWMSKLKYSEFIKAQFNHENILNKSIDLFKNQTIAVMKIADLVGAQNVLNIHNSDLVNDPNSTLTKICYFLEVKCSPEYLRSCSEKVFKSTSKSRKLVVWPQRLRDIMDNLIKRYTFFHRYSFGSE